ncbi:MAG: NAD(P)H-dependent glycerol-3-phosphate dehydrogenase [Janthinobacterium lividum]
MIGVLGAGAWGTALAQLLAGRHDVVLWARQPALAAAIDATRENAPYLPGVPLSSRIAATDDLDLVERRATDALLAVVPAQHLRQVLNALPDGDLAGAAPLILCAKGIEAGSHRLMHEVAAECCPGRPVAVLSGPTFAREVAQGLPTAATVAHTDPVLAERLAALFAGSALRPYTSTDVVGAEIGGAVKNVLAIACGVAEGAGLGSNARAALIARGFAEMSRFGRSRGARADTLAGLAGLGDLVLTCSSVQSRNFSLGVGIGRGERAADLLANRRTVAEGAATAPVLLAATRAAGVEMPVTAAVCDLLRGDEADAVMRALLARPLRGEDDATERARDR